MKYLCMKDPKNKKIEWHIETREVADLLPAEYNPRVLSEKAKEELSKSVSKFGQVEPLVVNVGDKLIGGHSRLKVYADLGIKQTPVMVPNRKLDAKEERELNLRLNKNTGEWDWSKMKDLFDVDELILAGFSDDELKVQFGLSDAGDVLLDEDRMLVLTVLPPEAPRLKEKAELHFDSKKDYDRVRIAIEDGRINTKNLLELL